jgi:3'(2'), 5'-bisphosphate nucleotidase
MRKPKADGSLQSPSPINAPKRSSKRGLKELAPEIPMLGEEAVADGRILPHCSGRFFCVDPLDGTRGFAKGGDEFTVNIALVRRRRRRSSALSTRQRRANSTRASQARRS